jgi:hypothetical protein
MARRHRRECWVCGARAPFVSISATGLCPDHSRLRLASNLYSLKAKQGPGYLRWRAALARSLGIDPLDARRDEG